MLRVIEDAKVVRQCQSRLLAQVEAATTEKKQHIIGFPGGSAEATVYYMGSLDFWMTLKPISNRYWNCGGLGYPFGSTAPAPHVEINPPLSGIDRRIAGAFLEDDDGVRYIAHNGKVGGGAKGVSKTAFLKHYPATSMVLSGDMEIPMYVVGRLDHPRLLDPRRVIPQLHRAARGDEPSAHPEAIGPDMQRPAVRSSAHGSPLARGRWRLGLVLQYQLETEHAGDHDQAVQRHAGRVGFERGQAPLADAKPGGDFLLGDASRLAPPSKDLADLLRGGDDELPHRDAYLPGE